MKTPDEIKEVLEHCIETGMGCHTCNYVVRCLKVVRGKPIMQDALALIRQLESDLEATKRERDAAVKDISRGSRCSVCKKFFKNNDDVGCSGGVYCIPLNFEWRGVCPDTEVQDDDH